MNRCKWVNLNNDLYVNYHDNEWGKPKYDDKYLFELLVLELFQAGLSWECVLNKREAFREAFDNFNYEIIANYGDAKVNELINNKLIIRNRLKINAVVIIVGFLLKYKKNLDLFQIIYGGFLIIK